LKTVNLIENSKVYTSNVYFVTGSWNALDGKNTLVDTGQDPSILERLESASAGVGKKRVEQVVLTHCHYDHTGMLESIRDLYDPVVYAFSPSMKGVSRLRDMQEIKMGDRFFEVIHAPGHSHDSVLLYNSDEGILFSGDTSFNIHKSTMTIEPEFLALLQRLCRKDIRIIYPGHGSPHTKGCNRMIHLSLDRMRRSCIVEESQK